MARRRSKTEQCPFPEVYFGGCCWGSAFYVGVYRAMWERWGSDMVANGLKVSGDSAGCVIALMVALGFHPDKLDAIYRRVGEQSHATQAYYNPWNNTGSSKYVEDVLRDAILTDPQSYMRLHELGFALGTTEFPYSHRWHTSFESNEDLLQVAQGCMHVPFYCRAIRTRVRGSFCVDGAYGFKGEDLRHGDSTLFVGIDPHAEVTRQFTNAQMFFPCVGTEYDAMVRSGYDAMHAWDGRFRRKVGQFCTIGDDSPFVLSARGLGPGPECEIPRRSVRSTTAVQRKTPPRRHQMGQQQGQRQPGKYWNPFRVPNHTALHVLWVMRFIEVVLVPLTPMVVLLLLLVRAGGLV